MKFGIDCLEIKIRCQHCECVVGAFTSKLIEDITYDVASLVPHDGKETACNHMVCGSCYEELLEEK